MDIKIFAFNLQCPICKTHFDITNHRRMCLQFEVGRLAAKVLRLHIKVCLT